MCCGSCIGSCLASCGCEALKCCLPSSKNATRLPYLILMFLSTVVALILRYWGGPMLIHLYIYDLKVCTSDKCVGFGAVYRISFALFIWFLVHALLLMASSCRSIDRSYWCVKIFGYFCLLVIAWIMPNEFFEGYVHVAYVVGGIFLFLQILILIDFAIQWNEDWVAKGWKAAVIGAALALYAASLVLIVFMFRWFGGSGCDLENFVLSFTIIMTLIITLLSITEMVAKAKRGGLLPAAVMALYIHYVAYSALSSDPSSCNSLNSTATVQLIIGMILGACSISYAAWNLATSNSLFGDPSDEDEKEEELNKAAASGDLGSGAKPASAAVDVAPAKSAEPAAAGAAAGSGDAKADKPAKADKADKHEELNEEEEAKYDQAHATRHMRFHFVMAAAAMYMAMILTNWSKFQVSVDETDETTVDFGTESMWIKIVTQWVTVIVYTWWLMGPVACPERFEVEQ